jgi:hypothetical protein
MALRNIFAGECVHVPQAHPLEKGGLVNLNKLGQGLVQPDGKVLPPLIAQSGQGNEVLGQVELPGVVGGDKIVIGHGLLGLQGGGIAGPEPGGQLLLPGHVAGEVLADGLLKGGGLLGPDGQDGGEPQLTDDLHQLGAGIAEALVFGKQHSGYRPFVSIELLYFTAHGPVCQTACQRAHFPV